MTEQPQYNVHPQSIEAEEAIISRILLDPQSLPEVMDIIGPQDFYRSAHQKIFASISMLANRDEPVDIISVHNALKEDGYLADIGGMTYLVSIMENVPLAVNAEHYAKIIKKTATLRQLIQVANNISMSAYATDCDAAQVLDDAQAEILDISINSGNQTFTASAALVGDRVDQIQEMAKSGKALGMPIGFPSFDTLTGGLRGATFVIIAARPRIGKSALMMNIANNIAKDGRKVGIFSIEMSKESLMDRQLSSKSGVNLMKLTTGRHINKAAGEWDQIQDAAAEIYKYQILIDDTGGIHLQELKRRARQMLKEGVDIIFIDQLSKIRGGKGISEYEQRSHVVNELAVLTKKLKTPVCLLAQINRKLEDRSNKKPTLGDLKSTGSLEEDADIVLLGHRRFEYTKLEEDLRHAEWEIAKNKQGATTNIEMDWDGKTVTFKELEKNYYPKGR